jgi:signal transduction histidine kinase
VAASPDEVLAAVADVLGEPGADLPSGDFYARLCTALCRLTSMQRALLFLYDPLQHRVRAVAGHGIDVAAFRNLQVTIDDAPIARRSLMEDRVVEGSGGVEGENLEDTARQHGVTTLACTPLLAPQRWLGVILADRGGEPFTLGEEERDRMWMLGKAAAVAVSARMATRQQERVRRLRERIDLSRELHDRVMQRLFGVSLALSSGRTLTAGEHARLAQEIEIALADLRAALEGTPERHESGTTLREELDRLGAVYAHLPLVVSWEQPVSVPSHLESLAQSVLAEALRNVDKHATPMRVDVRVERGDDAFVLEVVNDGTGTGARGSGMGLRLATLEAVQAGGLVEFGAPGPGRWRVRLVVPTAEPT